MVAPEHQPVPGPQGDGVGGDQGRGARAKVIPHLHVAFDEGDGEEVSFAVCALSCQQDQPFLAECSEGKFYGGSCDRVRHLLECKV